MRYVHLWFAFLKMSWMADLEYRLNILIRTTGEAGWYVAQLSLFEVLFTHSKTISGWDVHGMRVFMGAMFLSDVLYMIFLSENIEHFANLVKKGDLDLYLTKPINSQFLVSVRKMSTGYFLNFLVILGYLAWGISHLPRAVGVAQLFGFAMLILFGFLALYAMRFMFSTLSVILQDAGNIHFLWYQLYRLGMRPDPIYPFYFRAVIMTVFPVAFFASVPSRLLVEGFDWRLALAAPCFGLGLIYLSHRFWNFALKRYSSASS